MTQDQINQKWITNQGGIGYLEQPKIRPGRYQYTVDFQTAQKIKKGLKSYIKTLTRQRGFECDLMEVKSTVKGFKIHWFILAHCPNYLADGTGITEFEWDKMNEDLKNIVSDLSPSYIYHEKWTDKDKFQNRFETFVEVV